MTSVNTVVNAGYFNINSDSTGGLDAAPGSRRSAYVRSIWDRSVEARSALTASSEDDEQAQLLPSAAPAEKKPTPQYNIAVVGCAYVTLMAAVLAMSTIGAITLLLNRDHHVPNIMVWSWRAQVGWLCMLPCAAYQLVHMRPDQWAVLREPSSWLLWLAVSLCYLLWNSLFCVSLGFTTLPHALLFIDAHCILIVAAKLVLRKHVFLLEGLGALIAVAGGALTLIGKSLTHNWHDIALGDGIALLGAGFAAIYITFSKNFRRRIPLFVYLVPTILITFTGYTTGAVLFYDGEYASRSDRGMLGWTQLSVLEYALWLGLVTMLFGLSALVAVIKYLPGVVVSMVFLLNPVAGSIVGVLLHVASVPTPLELVGAGIMLAGTFAASYATRPAAQAALAARRKA